MSLRSVLSDDFYSNTIPKLLVTKKKQFKIINSYNRNSIDKDNISFKLVFSSEEKIRICIIKDLKLGQKDA
jgi:hypothetical protein